MYIRSTLGQHEQYTSCGCAVLSCVLLCCATVASFCTEDLEYSTASWATTAKSNSSAVPGQMHRGFALVAASLLPHIKAALTSLVKESSNGANIKNVYVSGHSLGAGVAALVSYAAQVRRRECVFCMTASAYYANITITTSQRLICWCMYAL
jgi:hypothetical protein